jgi:uncharacterized protein (TIGR02246 family)
MNQPNPEDVVKSLIEAINQGNLDGALSFCEPDAAFIVQPGNIVRGRDGIRAALQGFISLKPSLKGEAPQVVEAGDIALYCSRWTLQGTLPDGKPVEMSGVSSDVLRRQTDGRWLVAVDNPWGTRIVA